MLDDTNSIINYSRHHTREIRATIRTLSSEQKQRLLDEIQIQKATHNLFGRDYNHDDCKLIEKALQKEEK